jgi:putative membrane protein
MSILNRTRTAPPDPATAAPLAPAGPPSASPMTRVPLTRTGAVWFRICATALIFAVLIAFMLQNTRSVEISFLWMHGSLPLALALLIAAVGTAVLAMVVGTARTTQLRRASRRQRP